MKRGEKESKQRGRKVKVFALEQRNIDAAAERRRVPQRRAFAWAQLIAGPGLKALRAA